MEVKAIKNIDNTVNKRISNIKDDLRDMINMRFLANHLIDDKNQLIVNKNVIRGNAQEAVNIERIDIKCGSCGTTNKIIKGVSTECQYCHTMLQD